jgi:hypothetical protein
VGFNHEFPADLRGQRLGREILAGAVGNPMYLRTVDGPLHRLVERREFIK